MGKDDPTTEEQCDDKMAKVYERMNALDLKVSGILGGVSVLVFLLTFIVGVVAFHINTRFSGVEKAIEKSVEQTEKVNERLIGYITTHVDNPGG